MASLRKRVSDILPALQIQGKLLLQNGKNVLMTIIGSEYQGCLP
jgi:hypothetical protein